MPESIHTKDESERETAFAFIFGVNWTIQWVPSVNHPNHIWQNTLPAFIRKWVFAWNKTWRNYKFPWNPCTARLGQAAESLEQEIEVFKKVDMTTFISTKVYRGTSHKSELLSGTKWKGRACFILHQMLIHWCNNSTKIEKCFHFHFRSESLSVIS